MNAPLWVALPVVVLMVAAAQADVRTRRIPNLLTFPALVLGVAVHAALGGWGGARSAVAGALLAGAILLPGWRLRWMGAGDVKLMAAVGAWLAWPQALIAVLASLVMGGVIALVVALRRGVLRQALNHASVMAQAAMARVDMPPVSTGVRFPFALAVFAGSTLALWVRP
ncbi:MAG: prepilin peptidase [Candidatus Eisenbacteria bacterium]|nr:prepilin peptidase [Candidatus Eisenbacteria bacterium]